jgi:hypothetical protein
MLNKLSTQFWEIDAHVLEDKTAATTVLQLINTVSFPFLSIIFLTKSFDGRALPFINRGVSEKDSLILFFGKISLK